ncbi:MAG: hypothetical protein WCB68_12170 [Pyrinomonadaceae bacterium]
MKELGNSLAQLAAIIMILITIAVSTAAFSQWTSAPTESSSQSSPSQLVAGGDGVKP